jgi:hypothetical protein
MADILHSVQSGQNINDSAQTFAGAKTFSGALTPSSGIVGRTDGGAVAAGSIGEVKTVLGSEFAVTNNTTVTLASLTLTPGVWRVDYYCWTINGVPTNAACRFIANIKYGDSTFAPTTATNSDSAGVIMIMPDPINGSFSSGAANSLPGGAVVASGDVDKNVYVRGGLDTRTTGTGAFRAKIVATRIA